VAAAISLKRSTTISSGRNATADRAIDILLLFNQDQLVLTAAQVAEQLGLSRSATYRYLGSLRSSGLIEPSGRNNEFRLGPRVFELSRTARQGFGLIEVALPVMNELAASTQEAIVLTRRFGSHAVFIEYIDSRQPIRLSHQRGLMMPLHTGAAAKIILAYLPPAEIDEILASAPFDPSTDRTILDAETLRAQLVDIRNAGYSLTVGEFERGAWGVAAPILRADGSVAAGLCVSGPEYRLNDAMVTRAVAAVRTGAAEISRQIRFLDEA
jgi:DNA-binding IclR family transcriptional regulator